MTESKTETSLSTPAVTQQEVRSISIPNQMSSRFLPVSVTLQIYPIYADEMRVWSLSIFV